jgi:hypothetical protein
MDYSVKHDLGKDKAKQVTEAAYNSYKERFAKYSPTADWVGPYSCDITFTAKGIKLRGNLSVTDTTVDMDLQVPLLLRPFKKMALGIVSDEIEKWIAKAKAGEI